MALDTYSGLKTAIADTLLRDDLTALIPDWITLCEASVRRVLKSQDAIIETTVAGGSASNRFEDLPGDFYELASQPRVTQDSGDTTPIEYVTPQLMDRLWADIAQSPAAPQYFSIVGPRIEFFPQPNGHEITITYRQGVVALSDAAPSNALLLEAPDIYLYGSLLHSAPLLVDDARLPMWRSLYDTAMQEFNMAHLRKRFTGGPLRMRTRRPIGG